MSRGKVEERLERRWGSKFIINAWFGNDIRDLGVVLKI